MIRTGYQAADRQTLEFTIKNKLIVVLQPLFAEF
jgi:hypothetical protein